MHKKKLRNLIEIISKNVGVLCVMRKDVNIINNCMDIYIIIKLT